MPRKQRFKPSRKPKPSPQSEATTIGHDERSPGAPATVHNDNVRSDEDSGLTPETDRASR